jgi:glutamate-1-semialdehyde 2,1-aminomutase
MQFEKSKALYERAKKTIPGGIHSNVRANWTPTPLFYAHGEAAHLWDADGNEYIDYVLARGPLLLGHSPKPVLDAVKKQLDIGLMYAGQHELEIEAAEKFVEMVPCAEMVRFSNSGSEAVSGAMRLARGVTGRNKIVRFEGHYHGWLDNEFWNFAPPLDKAGPREAVNALPVSAGQVMSDAENLVVLPWNDLELVKAAFEKNPNQIAAVITEPIMCNTGAIGPVPGFLEGLRELCSANGAALIFDEVITGFRVALGGAQAYFGVTPDLATFAKGMAGGFPVSAIGGKRAWMEKFGDMSVTHSGTYNSSAPCMAATLAALNMLSADDGALLKHAHAMAAQLKEGIGVAMRKASKQARIRGAGAVFHVSFNEPMEATDYRTYTKRDAAAATRFWTALQDRGVRITPEGLWFVSTAITEADVAATLDAVRDCVEVV